MIQQTNIITGVLIIILNLIPLLTKKNKYFQVTILISLLIAAIRILLLP